MVLLYVTVLTVQTNLDEISCLQEIVSGLRMVKLGDTKSKLAEGSYIVSLECIAITYDVIFYFN